MHAHPDLMAAVSLPVFVIAWVVICRGLMARMGMSRDVRLTLEPAETDSGWGSANVNGVGCGRWIRLTAYQGGWLLRMMPLFGGGKLWLPRDRAMIHPCEVAGPFHRRQRMLRRGTTVVVPYGRLADAV